MTVTHIVAFRFKDSVTKEERVQVHTDFLHLKSACKKGDGKTFIEELVGGTSNDSTEGAGKDFDHSYVVTFANGADRDWYVNEDAAHRAFATHVRTLISDAFIYDFDH